MKHESIEINAGLLIILTLVVVSIGGLVEIVPATLFGDLEQAKILHVEMRLLFA